MSEAPEKIWAEHQTCTVDGSGAVRLLAMDREFSRGTEYTRTDTIPSPDALIRAALEEAVLAVSKIPTRTEKLGGQTFKYVKVSEVDQAIRALADDPETIARIVAQVKEGRG